MSVRVERIRLRETDGEPSFPQNTVDPFPAQLCQDLVKPPGWSRANTGLCPEQGSAQADQRLVGCLGNLPLDWIPGGWELQRVQPQHPCMTHKEAISTPQPRAHPGCKGLCCLARPGWGNM